MVATTAQYGEVQGLVSKALEDQSADIGETYSAYNKAAEYGISPGEVAGMSGGLITETEIRNALQGSFPGSTADYLAKFPAGGAPTGPPEPLGPTGGTGVPEGGFATEGTGEGQEYSEITATPVTGTASGAGPATADQYTELRGLVTQAFSDEHVSLGETMAVFEKANAYGISPADVAALTGGRFSEAQIRDIIARDAGELGAAYLSRFPLATPGTPGTPGEPAPGTPEGTPPGGTPGEPALGTPEGTPPVPGDPLYTRPPETPTTVPSVPTPLVGRAESSVFTPTPPEETGAGDVYTGRESGDIVREMGENLAYFTSLNNPALALARQRGLNLAEERGMGSGSFAARAAEGAVIDYASPYIREAQQLASGERTAAQGYTAESTIQAKTRRLQESMQQIDLAFQGAEGAADRQLNRDVADQQATLQNLLQERDLAVRSEDAAKTRQLDADIAAARLQIDESMQKRDLASLEYRNTQNLTSEERRSAAELTVRQMLQNNQYTAEQTMQLRDIAYREEVERLNREQRTLEQALDLAFQREDHEAARQIQLELTNIQSALQLTVQDRDIEFQEIQREMDRKLQLDMQDLDINYKEWLFDATTGHETMLESNRTAAMLLLSYQDQLGPILAEPNTTTAQKQASIDALKIAVRANLNALAAVLDTDLSGFAPTDVELAGDASTPGYETTGDEETTEEF